MSENNLKITPLKGPDRVRKRPSVVFGSTDSDGAFTAVCDILNVYIAEGMCGYCTKLCVKLESDGSVKMNGNGRPIVLCDGEENRWYRIFCELPTAPREGIDPSTTHNFMFGDYSSDPKNLPERTGVFYISAVQFCSEFMVVGSVKDGVKTSVRFEKGLCVQKPVATQCRQPDGTEIHFKLDKEIFSSVAVTKTRIEEYLESAARTIPSFSWEIKRPAK